VAVLGLATVAFADRPAHCPIPKDGLVAYYPFNEDCKDHSGNGNHGQPYGGPTWARGPVGAALQLDGVDDYVQIVPKSDVSKMGDFTVSVWTYMKGIKQQPGGRRDRQYIFDGHAQSATAPKSEIYRPGFVLAYDQQPTCQEICTGYLFSTKSPHVVQKRSAKVMGGWHHLVFVRKGFEVATYLDGKQLDGPDASTGHTGPLNMNHHWFVGTFAGNNPNYTIRGNRFNYSFRGMLDELRIYSRALSAGEVETIYGAEGKSLPQPAKRD